jgi:hypothetical protein
MLISAASAPQAVDLSEVRMRATAAAAGYLVETTASPDVTPTARSCSNAMAVRVRYSALGLAALANLWIAWYFNILGYPFA